MKDLTMDNYIQLGLMLISVISIVSPIIVSVIDNIYQFKIKKFENYDLSKIKALETFAQNAGTHIYAGVGSTEKELLNSLYGLLPYFSISKEDLDKFSHINSQEEYINSVQDLIFKLSKQLKPIKEPLIMRIIHIPMRLIKNN